MPRFDQIFNEPDSSPIKPEERVYVREILGTSQDVDHDMYLDTEARFTELSLRVSDGVSVELEKSNIFLCKSLRALYKKYGKLGDDMTAVTGGSDGTQFSSDRNRTRIALMIYNIVFPTQVAQPLEPIPAEIFDNQNATGIYSVPLRYGELPDLGDEFAPVDVKRRLP